MEMQLSVPVRSEGRTVQTNNFSHGENISGFKRVEWVSRARERRLGVVAGRGRPPFAWSRGESSGVGGALLLINLEAIVECRVVAGGGPCAAPGSRQMHPLPNLCPSCPL